MIAACLYVVGLLAQSWYGVLLRCRQFLPAVWNVLRVAGKIIVSTRDGLFEGFFFVALGMCLAFYNVHISKRKALIGFFVSEAALLAEVFFLQSIDFIREYDMFLCLAPAIFFLFCYLKQVHLPDKAIYKTLRQMSSLVYFSHIWIKRIITWATNRIMQKGYCQFLQHGPWLFVVILCTTLAVSFLLVKLSKTKALRSIRYLYS